MLYKYLLNKYWTHEPRNKLGQQPYMELSGASHAAKNQKVQS